jgi:hypothetical protein
MEYASGLYLKERDVLRPIEILPDIARKINILTLKERPMCGSTGCIVGFRWY